MFFYLRLCHAPPEGTTGHPSWDDIAVGCADFVIQLYGVRRFLAAIDRGDRFHDDNLIGALLSHACEAGWPELARRHNIEANSVHEYRQRYLISAITSKSVF